MGIPILRFTLSHTPKGATTQSISLPPNSLGVNIAGPNANWTTGTTPSVTIPGTGPVTTVNTDLWSNDYTFIAGRSYTISFVLPYAINANVASASLFFYTLDVSSSILSTDSKSIPVGTGTMSDSFTFTAPSGAVKFAFSGRVFNVLSNAGSTISLSSLSGSLVIPAESGSPTSKRISEPLGWKDAKLKLERHEDFQSLIEYFEGGFTFYGNNGIVDGGIDYIKTIENAYGFNASIVFVAEVSFDEVSYETIFNGQLDLTGLQEVKDNKIEVPVIRNDFWSKFILRTDTPVILSSTTDLDGNSVSAVPTVDIDLTGQKLRQSYVAYLDKTASFPGLEGIYIDTNDDFVQFDWNIETLTEIDEKFSLPINSNPVKPVNIFELKYPGDYTFNITIDISDDSLEGSGPQVYPGTYLSIFLQINDDTPISFTKTNLTTVFAPLRTRYTLNQLLNIPEAGGLVTIYGTRSNNDHFYVSYQRFDTVESIDIFNKISITADTLYPDTSSESYLLHDAFAGVVNRINGSNSFYSEVMGSAVTNMRTYASDGCFWKNVLLKGLQIRDYTLEEKPMMVTFNHLWKGSNPILGLSLSYDTVAGQEVIAVEDMQEQYDPTVSIYISNVRDITREYDESRIFNRIEVGFGKWESESASGIDDPQTKKVYSTPVSKINNALTMYSEFIAASYAIEVTRRQKLLKTKDYKFDNDTFIIAINPDDVSPDRYRPELAENFDSVTDLLNYTTRYNLLYTPARNALRWAKYWNGCLQKYPNNILKFVSAEGNYDMSSDYNCGDNCMAVVCDNLSERQDLPYSTLGFFYLPMKYTIEVVNFSWDDYLTIRNNRKKAIAISQSTSDYKRFFIKELTYEVCKGKAKIIAWPIEEAPIRVVESTQPFKNCTGEIPIPPYPGGFDQSYNNILDYAISQGYTLPSEDQMDLQNQFVIDLKNAFIWDDLDILYVFATDGNTNFAKINWINPGLFQAQEFGSVTFTTNVGFQGDGLTGYISTTWTPSVNGVKYTLNNASANCYITPSGAAAVSQVEFGVRSTANSSVGQLGFVAQTTGNVHNPAVNSGGFNTGTAVSEDGFYICQRTASNAQRLFKNGSQVGATNTSASNILPSREVLILATLNGASGPSGFSTRQMSMFCTGASQSGRESAFNTAWNNYFTSL